jgi:hypothetical protein
MHNTISLETRREKPLRISRRRWEDNIKMYLTEIGYDNVGSGYGPVARSCENGDEPSGSITGTEFID